MIASTLLAIFFAILAVTVNGSPIPANGDPTKGNGSPAKDSGSPAKDSGSNKGTGSQSSHQIKFCTSPDFGGKCDSLPFNNNACVDVPSDFNNKISSFSFDQGISCTLFADAGCGGNSVPLAAPGSSKLADLSTSSYKCTN